MNTEFPEDFVLGFLREWEGPEDHSPSSRFSRGAGRELEALDTVRRDRQQVFKI